MQTKKNECDNRQKNVTLLSYYIDSSTFSNVINEVE